VFEPRRVAKFAFFVLLFYSLLTVPWAGWDSAYAAGFRAGGNAVFSRFWFWPQATAKFLNLKSPTLFDDIDAVTPGNLPKQFKPPQSEDVVQDTLMVLMNNDVPGSIGMLRTSSRPIGYWPTAVFLSLLLATPIRWKRKLIALAVGLLLVHGFVAFRVTVLLLKGGFADPAKKYALFHPTAFWQDVWRRAGEVFADNPTFAYVVPVFIWLAVVFLVHLFERKRASSPTTGAPAAA